MAPLAVILFAVLTLPVSGGEGAASPAAAVGNGVVSKRDIADWRAAQACYGPDAITSRRAGFMRMFETALLEEVLNGPAARPIKREEYAGEVSRIDAETRAPEILACIKKYFGDDTARYERVFVRPLLAQRFIREYVRTSPEVQAGAYALRDGISSDVVKGAAFRDIAVARGVKYSTAVYALEAPAAPVAPAAGLEPWARWSPFQAAFIEEHLQALKPGQAKEPIEDEANIRFVRLLSVTGKKYYFESLTVPKLSTEAYLKTSPGIPCRINDRELRAWVLSIKGNPLLAPARIK